MESIQQAKETTAVRLGSLLDAGDGAVVTLAAGDTYLAAHRVVLVARSPVFAAMFNHDTLEASSGLVTIPDVEGPVLRELLSYLYTLQAPHVPGMAPQLLTAADKYGVSGLKAACEQQLADQLSVETAAATAVLAVRHCCDSLLQAAVSFIKAHTHQVMATQGLADAVHMHPEDVVEVSRLLAAPPAETSDCSRTPASAAPVTAASRCTPPPDDDAPISCLRSLSETEKQRRLIAASVKGAVVELEALLAEGVDVGARDWGMKTALHWAAGSGHVEAARRLVASGAALDAKDSGQWTPLHWATWSGHTAVVRLLLASHADHSARDMIGRTPLHWAAATGRAGVATALLEAGADREATNDRGETPLDLARQNDKQHLVRLLRGT